LADFLYIRAEAELGRIYGAALKKVVEKTKEVDLKNS
jgi:hypothetical protein